ncbi:MAG: sigma-70 family RNA polymerase sigma factor [Actinomycetota bacterium]|nr:sigma-70 family RNA polymerase sigma factor [Actinomycetota bacterium]
MSQEPGPHADPDEVERVARDAAAGDRAALEHLLGLVQPRVMRICARMLPCREDAEEACQDALLRVATKIDTFQGNSKFTTWLYVVAGNSARQTYRSLKRRSRERPVDEMPTAADPRTTSVIAGSRLDLLEALETLDADSPDLVEAVVMRDISGLDYNEIAQALDIPLGTVKSRIHKARQRLRPLLIVSG